jgi:uncharacterized protein (DUF1330 family)
MKTKYQLAIALLAGAVIGGAAIQELRAQAKPPAFVVAEIDVTNQEGFAKEFGPAARKALAIGAGYKALVLGGKTTSIDGAPPKNRIVINAFDNIDEAMKAYHSQGYQDARKIGNKYATFRIYAVEGVAK